MLRIAAFVLAALCVVAWRTAPPAAQSFAGTYEIYGCTAPCDPSGAGPRGFRGRLVISDTDYPLSQIPEPARTYFSADMLLFAGGGDTMIVPNVCFQLTRPAGADTYAGITPIGVTRWTEVGPGAIRMRLFQSPDAGYVVSLSARGTELRGTGESWGGADPRTRFPRDSVVARRVGPPDPAPCFRAAGALADSLRRDQR